MYFNASIFESSRIVCIRFDGMKLTQTLRCDLFRIGTKLDERFGNLDGAVGGQFPIGRIP